VKQYGVTVYAPGYRLAWRKPYPAAVEDCYRVLEYMSKKGEPVMVGGESAGGGLCEAVCILIEGQTGQPLFLSDHSGITWRQEEEGLRIIFESACEMPVTMKFANGEP